MNIKKLLGSAALTAMLLTGFSGCGDSSNETAVAPKTTNSTDTSPSNTNLTTSAINVLQSPELARVANSISTVNGTDAEMNKLKVQLAQNPESIDNESAKKIVAEVAQKQLGKTVNGAKVTQADIDAFMTYIDSNGLYFMAIMEAYANEKGINTDALEAKNAPLRAKRGIFKGGDSLLDIIKDGLVDVVATDAITDLTADAFRLVLQSDGVTTAMLDMAINSETITDIMVTVMEDNWDLTEPMIPMMLNPENDYEFTRKFLQLAQAHKQQIGTMTFSYIDTNLYDTITKVMVLSPAVNTAMGQTMVLLGKNHFIIPGSETTITRNDQPDLYAGKDAFARLMLDINNSTTNERLFYALFAKSDTTDAFVKTMQQVKKLDADTATYFMDNIFLGGSIEKGYATIDQAHRDQAFQNIYTITKAMLDGYEAEGLAPYSGSFVGFAGLIPFDRYVPYAKGMGSAAYYYATTHGYSLTGTIGSFVKDKFFPEENSNTIQKASLRQSNALSDGLDWFANLFGSYSAWLDSATAYLTDSTIGKTLESAFTAMLDSTKVGIDAALAEAKKLGHDAIEAKIQVTIQDGNYTLPPFEDITLAYITSTAKTTALEILDDPARMKVISDANRTQELYAYVNSQLKTNEYLGYIPTWMTKLDWIQIPASVDGIPVKVINYSAGSIDVYILSDNADMVDLQTNILGNQVLLKEVAIKDSPLVVDANEDISKLHVYKFTVYASDIVDVNQILGYLGTYLTDTAGAVALDTSAVVK